MVVKIPALVLFAILALRASGGKCLLKKCFKNVS